MDTKKISKKLQKTLDNPPNEWYNVDATKGDTAHKRKEINTMTPAERLIAAREVAHITRAELSRRTGIPLRTIENWELGYRNPKEYVVNNLITEIERKLKNMTIYEIRKDSFEFRAKGINSPSKLEDAFIDSDFGGATILKTESESEATAELKKYKSTACTMSGTVGNLIVGDIVYIEKYEANSDGEFISGADFIFAEWSTNIFE